MVPFCFPLTFNNVFIICLFFVYTSTPGGINGYPDGTSRGCGVVECGEGRTAESGGGGGRVMEG